MKINFDGVMQTELESLKERNKILLHCCCAPCASACLERLKDYLDIWVLFYNPNIEKDEYIKRRAEIERFISLTGWAKIFETDHDEREFYDKVMGLEHEKEGGKRCGVCFGLRLKKTRDLAEENGFDYFATTLTLSPLKNAELINSIGVKLQEGAKTKYLPSDFKKRNGYLRSIALSKEYGLYRQNYCGCVYSRGDK